MPVARGLGLNLRKEAPVEPGAQKAGVAKIAKETPSVMAAAKIANIFPCRAFSIVVQTGTSASRRGGSAVPCISIL
jgi:hypothetical protein